MESRILNFILVQKVDTETHKYSSIIEWKHMSQHHPFNNNTNENRQTESIRKTFLEVSQNCPICNEIHNVFNWANFIRSEPDSNTNRLRFFFVEKRIIKVMLPCYMGL